MQSPFERQGSQTILSCSKIRTSAWYDFMEFSRFAPHTYDFEWVLFYHFYHSKAYLVNLTFWQQWHIAVWRVSNGNFFLSFVCQFSFQEFLFDFFPFYLSASEVVSVWNFWIAAKQSKTKPHMKCDLSVSDFLHGPYMISFVYSFLLGFHVRRQNKKITCCKVSIWRHPTDFEFRINNSFFFDKCKIRRKGKQMNDVRSLYWPALIPSILVIWILQSIFWQILSGITVAICYYWDENC